jgi:2-polyprenyl-3-methyl-5-hydroxy-6-metoxy-1,4-benzoquinol methylase
VASDKIKNSMDYIEINRQSWNNRVATHINSAFYDMPNFLQGNTSLKSIELDLLGDVKGKSILHLQCHFGQDSISLARMGAQVTGVDLSNEAIEKANELANAEKANANFICCNLYDLPQHLHKQFDIVFTTYGTITWLPDLNKWAQLITQYLKPGGQFVFADFHPVVWLFDDNFEKIAYSYFNTGAILESETGTYADKQAPIAQDYVIWNHGIAEVLGSLIKNGLRIEQFNEFDYSPYNCFNNTEEFEAGKFRIKHLENKIPMVFSLLAYKD